MRSVLTGIRNKVTLIVIVSISLVTGLYKMTARELHIDEIHYIGLAKLHIVETILKSTQDVHPPFYYILLGQWIRLFGTTVFSVRFLSIIFFSLAVFSLYKLAEELFNWKVAMYSSLILSLSAYTLHYAQSARMYSLLLLLSICSCLWYIRSLKSNDPKSLLFFTLSTVLLIYTHLYGFLLLLIEIAIFAIYLLSYKTKLYQKLKQPIQKPKWLGIALTIIFLVYIPWIFVIVQQKSARPDAYLNTPTVLNIFLDFAGTQFMLFFFALVLVSGLINKGKEKAKFLFLILIIAATIMGLYLVSYLWYPILLPRYLMFFGSLFYIAIGYSLSQIKNKMLIFGVVISIVIGSIHSLDYDRKNTSFAEIKAMTAYIDANANIGDLLVFNPGYVRVDGYEFYTKRTDITTISFPKNTEQINKPVTVTTLQELDPILKAKHYRTIWLIENRYTNEVDLITTKFAEYGYNFVKLKGFTYAWVYEYSR